MSAVFAAPSAIAGRIAAPPADFTAIDDPDLQDAFTRPAGQAGRRRVFVAIDGMHCAACAVAIEDRLARTPSVVGADVNVAAGSAVIEWDAEGGTPLSRVFAAIESAGAYRAFPAGDHAASAARDRERRRMFFRLGVAGLCMMQVMMYAWPSYLGSDSGLTPDIARLLEWASLMMSLPVVLFSAWPFYANAWGDLRRGRVGMDLPVALGVLIAFFGSAWGMASGTGEVWFDSLTMFVFFLLGGRYLELLARRRAASDIERITRRLPASVDVLRHWPDAGEAARVAAHRVRPGDVVRVAVGEAFPGDGVVLEGESAADESVLTGESRPRSKRPGDAVVAGSFNLQGPLVLRVERTGADSRFGQVIALMERAAAEKPRLAELADGWARWFLVGVLALAAMAGLGWWMAGSDRALWVVVSVLVVTCPCALSLAAPMTAVTALGRLARQGVLVTHPRALETLATVTHAVFDKTGTLTRAVPSLVAVEPLRGDMDADRALALAALLDRGSRHPLARSLVAAAQARGLSVDGRVDGVTERAGQGVEGRVDGRTWTLGADTSAGADAAAGPSVLLSDGEGPVARFRFDDGLRDDAVEALEKLRADGLRTALLSGDGEEAVASVARRAGIDAWRARATPADKLAEVESLQAGGARLLMVGDGINDGPVLSRADVSVAMGAGAPIAQSSADLVLLSDRLSDLPLAREVARRSLRITRQNLAWAAAYNAVCVPVALAGWLPPWAAGLGMAASSLLVVLNALRLAR